ncbi:glycosyltransferase family protein [Winogradskyella ursingii]|uniref:UDP-glycosyltransferase n=1 Tax=Winogradskyella ursingii TaxID=2686079 RepID=UPI0015CCE944|nr:UDP-glycosyltransferase [Winogradskyella ursingii]
MMRKELILIVSESIDVNDSSATKGRVALIKNLQQCGFNLMVYHYTRKNIEIEGVECIEIREKKWNIYYLLSKIQLIIRRAFNYNIGIHFEKRIGFSFSFFNDVKSIKMALQNETDFEPDWVLTLSKASSFRTHMALLEIPKWHQKWLAYVHDPYPMSQYPEPYNWLSPGHQQQEEFFRQVAKKAAHAIFPSKLLKEWMGKFYPEFNERGLVIPHQISVENTQKEHGPSYFKENFFTILHAGSLMKPRNPSGLVEGFQQFLNNNETAKIESQILLLGNKTYFADYLNKKSKEMPQLYLSSGYVEYNEVQYIQNHTSVNVILEAKSDISPFLPGKFPHCIKANKPILYLGPKHSETLRLLGEGYEFSAEIDQTDEIAQHVEQLYKNWKNRSNERYLNRTDLDYYLGREYLEKVFKSKIFSR